MPYTSYLSTYFFFNKLCSSRCWQVRWPKKDEYSSFKDANEVWSHYVIFYYCFSFLQLLGLNLIHLLKVRMPFEFERISRQDTVLVLLQYTVEVDFSLLIHEGTFYYNARK